MKPTDLHDDLGWPGTAGFGTGSPSGGADQAMEDAVGIEVFPSEGPPDEAAVPPPDLAAPAAPEVKQRAEPDALPVAAPVAEPVAPVSLPDTDLQLARLEAEPAPQGRQKMPALSIADLIDNHVRLEWHEAVAIALYLCSVMSKEPGANVHRSLVEPWNVEITNAGEVHVLPGGSSSDPLVKQVGRVLRALLQDSIAPAELRLVASQASFEVPVYSSVDELSAALMRFDRAGNSEAIRAAFNRGLEAKFAAHVPHEPAPPEIRPVSVAAHAPVKRASLNAAPRPAPDDERSSSGIYLAGGIAAVVAVAAAGLAVSRVTEIAQRWSSGSTPLPAERLTPATPRTPSLPEKKDSESVRPPSAPTPSPHNAPSGRAAAPPSRSVSSARGVPEGEVPTAPRSPGPVQRAPAATDSFDTAVQRAAALLAEGRAGEASVIFDFIVMKNPLYQLDPARSTPEALAAFQTSKRLLLPAMARRYYQEARTAYDAGDFAMTLTKGERALALLRDADIDPSESSLNGDVTDLMALATSARTIEESRIYSSADRDVTPPRPIGRQLSTASLSGRAPLTGRLELVVGRTGEVETVKLDTPVNGYHDRMIVSAAKAWHYRPALKKGHPVRYSMVMSITLPDF